jgi:hypothetical protein
LFGPWFITTKYNISNIPTYLRKSNKKLMNIVFIHSVACLTTGPYSLSEWVLPRVWYTASSSNFLYPRFYKVIK